MAARTVQINSFCGGSSKLADSEFLGMEESINVYPETVTATDSYTTKMLKSVEGFSGTSFSGEKIIGITSVNNTPWYASSVREALLVVTRNNDSSVNHVYAVYGGTKTEVGTFSGVYGDKAVVQELSNGIALVLTYGHLFAANPSSTASPAPTCAGVTLPDAFDHAGEIYPTQMALLNFRVILNDAEHDYIYWSELNRPTDALDTGAFEQSLTQYAYTKNDGTVVTFDDNVFYAPAVGTYDPATLTTQVVSTSALNSMKMDFKADKVVAMRATDSSLFVFGQNSLQILRWQNSTTAPFAIVAKTSQAGVMFADAVAVIGSECFYVGKGPQGALGVYAVDENGNIRKISSNAVDQRLARMPSGLGEVKAFAYAYKGHTFFVFKASSFYGELAETMAFDIGEEVWGDRVSFDSNGNRCAWTAVDSCTIEGKPHFATRTHGGLWRVSTFNPAKFTDQYLNENPLVDGTNPLVRERTTGIKFDGINDIVVTALELVMNAGETTQTDPSKNGYNPRVMLQVSTDGGRTWSNELWAFAGKVGQYSWRVRWNGLGRGARFAFRVRMTDPVAFEIATAYLSYLPCGNRV